jgi:hypothetical protein
MKFVEKKFSNKDENWKDGETIKALTSTTKSTSSNE